MYAKYWTVYQRENDMRLEFSYKSSSLRVLEDDGSVSRSIAAFSVVRNELNGERPDSTKLPDVVYSENQDGAQGLPVMPRSFPIGTWNVTGYEPTSEQWLKPIKLITDAHQSLDIWALNPDGSYDKPTGQKIDDFGYRIHFANGSHHTDGCIGSETEDDIRWLSSYGTFPCKLDVTE